MFLNDNKPGFCQTELVLSHYKSLCNPHGNHVASKIAEIQGKTTKNLIFSNFEISDLQNEHFERFEKLNSFGDSSKCSHFDHKKTKSDFFLNNVRNVSAL